MKENRFKEIVQTINSESAMDERIINRLSNYESSNTENLSNKLVKIFSQKTVVGNIIKTAAACVMVIILGTTTVMAASYLIKSYTIKDFKVIPEEEASMLLESTVTKYGDGQKDVTIYQDGVLIQSPTTENNAKYGDEVFAVLGLPNLTPTYVSDHYLLEDGYYDYIETKSSDGSWERKSISAGFRSGSKYVYMDYAPSDTSKKDTSVVYANDNVLIEDFIFSTYTTSGGLICDLMEDTKSNTISASILFDSKVLGNASYLLSFSHVEMDEIKMILDSIPLENITQ